ncbi:transposase [Chitinophagaceae bacterium LWZ2-11]
MPEHRRKFTIADKKNIIRQADQIGVINTLKTNNLSYSVFIRWREKLYEMKAMSDSLRITDNIPAIKNLQEENLLLKKIIANQAIELEMKSEELKKHSFSYGKR